MLGCLPLLSSDLGNLLAIPFRLSPRGKERVTPSAMFVVGISLEAAVYRRYSLEVARRSGWRESERSPYSCPSIAGLCGTRCTLSYGRSE
jgi:hypothetical protein